MDGGQFFVFFKQKTAYEMRISDWSPDVCSSDLKLSGSRFEARSLAGITDERVGPTTDLGSMQSVCSLPLLGGKRPFRRCEGTFAYPCCMAYRRSEEHTSELQSLMRISYAVFCLKKKKKTEIST